MSGGAPGTSGWLDRRSSRSYTRKWGCRDPSLSLPHRPLMVPGRVRFVERGQQAYELARFSAFEVCGRLLGLIPNAQRWVNHTYHRCGAPSLTIGRSKAAEATTAIDYVLRFVCPKEAVGKLTPLPAGRSITFWRVFWPHSDGNYVSRHFWLHRCCPGVITHLHSLHHNHLPRRTPYWAIGGRCSGSPKISGYLLRQICSIVPGVSVSDVPRVCTNPAGPSSSLVQVPSRYRLDFWIQW